VLSVSGCPLRVSPPGESFLVVNRVLPGFRLFVRRMTLSRKSFVLWVIRRLRMWVAATRSPPLADMVLGRTFWLWSLWALLLWIFWSGLRMGPLPVLKPDPVAVYVPVPQFVRVEVPVRVHVPQVQYVTVEVPVPVFTTRQHTVSVPVPTFVAVPLRFPIPELPGWEAPPPRLGNGRPRVLYL
jgi:hypothetical protein